MKLGMLGHHFEHRPTSMHAGAHEHTHECTQACTNRQEKSENGGKIFLLSLPGQSARTGAMMAAYQLWHFSYGILGMHRSDDDDNDDNDHDNDGDTHNSNDRRDDKRVNKITVITITIIVISTI